MLRSENSPISVEEKRAALQEVLSSPVFSRAEQLRQFLRWICEREIDGRSELITEYAIGVEALGRPPDFVPGDESCVRTRAHALRQKLRQHYETQATGALIRIELLKGSYVPRFVECPAKPAAPDEMVEPAGSEEEATPRRRFRFPVRMALFVGGLLLGIVATVLIHNRLRVPEVTRKAWGPLADGDEVLVCVSTPGHLMVNAVPGGPAAPRHHPLPDATVLSPMIIESFPHWKAEDLGTEFTVTSVRFGEAQAMATAVRLLTDLRVPFRLVLMRTIGWPTMSGRNIVLLGSPEFSLTARRLLARAPYSIRYDTEASDLALLGSGRKLLPQRGDKGLVRESYGLITVRPSEGSADGNHRTVVISGLSSAGTQAAMEFFTSDGALRTLRQKTGGAFPSAYQVIVRCTAHEDVMLSFDYFTHAAFSQN